MLEQVIKEHGHKYAVNANMINLIEQQAEGLNSSRPNGEIDALFAGDTFGE